MTDIVKNLYKIPKKDKGLNVPHIFVPQEGHTQQADLLFLPEDPDHGFKYALVVVDASSGITQAEPLKTKDANDVLRAFKKIYKKGILKLPQKIEFDSGSEFKASVAKYFIDNNVRIRVGKPNRHRMQALAERRNQTIATNLFMRMTAQELITGEPSKEWVEDIPAIIKDINKRAKERKPRKVYETPVCEGDSCNMLSVGDKVRVALDEPINAVTEKRLHGHFRSTDIRWNPNERVIRQLVLRDNQPPMYLLDGNSGKYNVELIGYTKNQLQVIDPNEKMPDPSVIRGKPTYYRAEKILGKKNIGGKMHYLIKWKGFPITQATYEPRDQLMIDIPDMINAYDND